MNIMHGIIMSNIENSDFNCPWCKIRMSRVLSESIFNNAYCINCNLCFWKNENKFTSINLEKLIYQGSSFKDCWRALRLNTFL